MTDQLRVHASEFLDYDRLPSLVEEGLLSCREHPGQPLFIYNYTARCQYERAWTTETLACRGLVLDADGHVLARPFRKFFNIGEETPETVAPVPVGSDYLVSEKLDGSLGIAYRDPITGQIAIATRGAFASEQALWATEWWQDNARGVEIPDGETWLFEIIYPDNRIVVNYGDRAELVLLAVIDNATGHDRALPEHWPGAMARRWNDSAVEELIDGVDEPQNFEGFVLYYPTTGQRAKVKLDEYVRLHRLLTHCSSKAIWELLASGQGLGEMLDHVPDEFFAWVRGQEAELLASYAEIERDCTEQFDRLAVADDRKASAAAFTKQAHPAVLFRMLDGKDYAPIIWKAIKPTNTKPFVEQFETAQ